MFNSVLEECKKVLRDKSMLLILFIIPIAVNLLIGFEFQNNQIINIPMAVIDYDNSSLSRMIINQFEESETFSVKYKLTEETDLKKLIDNGNANVGMIIPVDFSQDISKLSGTSILMIYDGSNMSVASTAKSKASEILLTLKTGISMKIIGGKLMLPEDISKNTAMTIKFSGRFLYNPAKSYKNFLNPGLGVAIVQTSIVLLGAVCIKKEKLGKDYFTDTSYIFGKVIFYTTIGTMMLLCSVLIQNRIFNIPFRGNFIYVIALSFLMALAIASFAVMISVWVSDTTFASLIVAVLFIPSTALAGYTYPMMAMPGIYKILASLMPFGHYGSILRDLYLKGVPFMVLLNDLRWFCCFFLFSFLLSCAGILCQNLQIYKYFCLKLAEEEA